MKTLTVRGTALLCLFAALAMSLPLVTAQAGANLPFYDPESGNISLLETAGEPAIEFPVGIYTMPHRIDLNEGSRIDDFIASMKEEHVKGAMVTVRWSYMEDDETGGVTDEVLRDYWKLVVEGINPLTDEPIPGHSPKPVIFQMRPPYPPIWITEIEDEAGPDDLIPLPTKSPLWGEDAGPDGLKSYGPSVGDVSKTGDYDILYRYVSPASTNAKKRGFVTWRRLVPRNDGSGESEYMYFWRVWGVVRGNGENLAWEDYPMSTDSEYQRRIWRMAETLDAFLGEKDPDGMYSPMVGFMAPFLSSNTIRLIGQLYDVDASGDGVTTYDLQNNRLLSEVFGAGVYPDGDTDPSNDIPLGWNLSLQEDFDSADFEDQKRSHLFAMRRFIDPTHPNHFGGETQLFSQLDNYSKRHWLFNNTTQSKPLITNKMHWDLAGAIQAHHPKGAHAVFWKTESIAVNTTNEENPIAWRKRYNNSKAAGAAFPGETVARHYFGHGWENFHDLYSVNAHRLTPYSELAKNSAYHDLENASPRTPSGNLFTELRIRDITRSENEVPRFSQHLDDSSLRDVIPHWDQLYRDLIANDLLIEAIDAGNFRETAPHSLFSPQAPFRVRGLPWAFEEGTQVLDADKSYERVYETYAIGDWEYEIPVPEDGAEYVIALKLAEPWEGASDGSRVFDVIAEGEVLFESVDIHSMVTDSFLDPEDEGISGSHRALTLFGLVTAGSGDATPGVLNIKGAKADGSSSGGWHFFDKSPIVNAIMVFRSVADPEDADKDVPDRTMVPLDPADEWSDARFIYRQGFEMSKDGVYFDADRYDNVGGTFQGFDDISSDLDGDYAGSWSVSSEGRLEIARPESSANSGDNDAGFVHVGLPGPPEFMRLSFDLGVEFGAPIAADQFLGEFSLGDFRSVSETNIDYGDAVDSSAIFEKIILKSGESPLFFYLEVGGQKMPVFNLFGDVAHVELYVNNSGSSTDYTRLTRSFWGNYSDVTYSLDHHTSHLWVNGIRLPVQLDDPSFTGDSLDGFRFRLTEGDPIIVSLDNITVKGYGSTGGQWVEEPNPAMLFDFGKNLIAGKSWKTPGNWNNLTRNLAGDIIDAIDVRGNNSDTDVNLEIIAPFDKVNRWGLASGSVTNTFASRDSFVVDPGNTGMIKLSGLDPNFGYDFVFHATLQRTRGMPGDVNRTRYTIGSESVTLDPYEAKNMAVAIGNVVPNSDGEIVIEVSGDGPERIGYIGYMKLQRNAFLNP